MGGGGSPLFPDKTKMLKKNIQISQKFLKISRLGVKIHLQQNICMRCVTPCLYDDSVTFVVEAFACIFLISDIQEKSSPWGRGYR